MAANGFRRKKARSKYKTVACKPEMPVLILWQHRMRVSITGILCYRNLSGRVLWLRKRNQYQREYFIRAYGK